MVGEQRFLSYRKQGFLDLLQAVSTKHQETNKRLIKIKIGAINIKYKR